MLISEFSKRAGLSVDTVRFYVRLGLLRPEAGTKGGRNPYQTFSTDHLEVARIVRMARALGFSLKEIAQLGEEHRSGQMTRARSAEIMQQQLARLDEKAAQIGAMAAYLRAKVAWLKSDGDEPEPQFSDYAGTSTFTLPLSAVSAPRD
jgi:MerR family transcriptional regulator, copper efflux regulator